MSISIEVTFVDEDQQKIIEIKVPSHCTAKEAILLSGILFNFPSINFKKNKIGIFGKLCELDTLLKASDRIEIYRPLRRDPKKSRLRRAQRLKKRLHSVQPKS